MPIIVPLVLPADTVIGLFNPRRFQRNIQLDAGNY